MVDENTKKIEQILKEAVSSEYQEDMKPTYKILLDKAKKLLNLAKIVEGNGRAKTVVDKLKGIAKAASTTETPEDLVKKLDYQSIIYNNKNAASTQEFYRALFDFDKYLNMYLGEMSKRAVYVFINPDGEVKTYEMSLQELANKANKDGRIRADFIKAKKYQGASIEEQIGDEEDLKHQHQGAAAVYGTVSRLNRYYQLTGKTGGQRQSGLLMWKNGGVWSIVNVVNKGVIGEAYVNYLFTKHRSANDFLFGIDAGQSPYYSHHLIEQFYKYLEQVTNKAAILEEDVIGQYAQYAVKTNKAPLPSVQQYVKVASYIALNSAGLDPANIKDFINKDFNREQGKLAPFIGNFVDGAITTQLKPLMENMKLTLKDNQSVSEIKNQNFRILSQLSIGDYI